MFSAPRPSIASYHRPTWTRFPLHLSPEGDASGGDDEAADRAASKLFKSKEAEGALGQFAKELWDDNKKYRERQATLKAENKELKAKVPAEGAVVIAPGDDAAAYAAIVKLNLPLKDIAAKLEQAAKDAAELADVKGKAVIAEAAALVEEDTPWDPDVLVDRLKADAYVLTIADVEETIDGEKVTRKVPRVRPAADAAASLVDLLDHAEARWSKYLPALRAGDAPAATSAAPRRSAKSADQPAQRTAAPVTKSGERKNPPPAPDLTELEQRALATGHYPTF